jgi:hypothetical protein
MHVDEQFGTRLERITIVAVSDGRKLRLDGGEEWLLGDSRRGILRDGRG